MLDLDLYRLLYLDLCMRDFRPMMPAGSPVFFVNVHVLGSELDKRACTPPRPPVPQFAKALGVELDLTDKGLGVRSRRYAMLVEDQVVKVRQSPHQGCMYCFLAVAAVNPCPSLLAPTAALPPPSHTFLGLHCGIRFLPFFTCIYFPPCICTYPLQALNLEEGGAFTTSSADEILAALA